jgi:hypothetical protein
MVVSQADFDRYRGPQGVCSAVMAAKAGVVLQSSALACTVDSTGRKLSASSTRLQFGHLVTESVAKLQPDHGTGTYPYFSYPDANQGDNRRAEHIDRWNSNAPTPAAHRERLQAVRSDPMLGYILGVFSHWDATTEKYGLPIVRIIAAPSLMTTAVQPITQVSDGRIPGSLHVDDVWEPRPPFLEAQEAITPLLASAGGSYRDGQAPASMTGVLEATDPVVVKSSNDITGFKTVAGVTVWRSWFLPKGCNAPVGMTWDLENLTFDEILESVKVAFNNKSSTVFIATLERHRDELTDWLSVATSASEEISVQVIPWASFAPVLPCVNSGVFPEIVDEPDLLGPIQDMITLYTWRHIVDYYQIAPTARVAQYFHRYIERMRPAIPPTSYMGDQLDPVVLPNVPYHFPINGGWPFDPDWCDTFKMHHFTSPQAKLWAPSMIDVQHPPFEGAGLGDVRRSPSSGACHSVTIYCCIRSHTKTSQRVETQWVR